jgi:hypothetical protein
MPNIIIGKDGVFQEGFFNSDGGVSETNLVALYSLRSPISYSGDVIEVRRSSDNALNTFTSSEVSDGTLESFVGSGNDGFMRTWFDQSGSTRDTQQTSASFQPKIVDSGSLVTENGNPAVEFDGSTTYFDRLTTTEDFGSIFLVTSGGRVADGPTHVVLSPVGFGTSFSSSISFGTASNRVSSETINYFTGYIPGGVIEDQETISGTLQPPLNTNFLSYFDYDSIYINGQEANPYKFNQISTRNLKFDYRIGQRLGTFNQYFDGVIQEVIFYSDSKTNTERQKIEDDLINYYSL